MTFIVTLTDYTPAARYDGEPWTQARLEEAASRAGTYTPLETFTLDPVDADPEAPAARSFTSDLATLEAGWYRIVWLDEDGHNQATEPVLNAPFRPSVADVARQISARTVANGGQQGTFTTATRPTATAVEGHIDDAAAVVLGKVGLQLPNGVWSIVRTVIAVRAAMLIERGADDFNEARYDRLRDDYKDRLAELTEATQEAEAGGDPGDVDDQVLPLHSFPSLCEQRAEGAEAPVSAYDPYGW
jgi:hypothetical protein